MPLFLKNLKEKVMFVNNSNTGGLGKKTTDPNENKTWDVAKKLGVAQELNLANEDVRRDFANGVKNAANVVKFKNLDTDHPDVLKYTEALIKKSLAEPIQDETPWVKAMEDAKTALSNSKAKVYQSPSLKRYIQLRSKKEASGVINNRTNDDNTNFIQPPKQYDKILTFKEPRLDPVYFKNPIYSVPEGYKDISDISTINNDYVYKDIYELSIAPIDGSTVNTSPKTQWVDVAKVFKAMDYNLASELLMHSLQNDPSDLYFGDDSEVAQMIKADENFLSYLDEVMDEHKGEQEFTVDMVGFTFDDKDLFFSIHGITGGQSILTGTRLNDNSYQLQIKIIDDYNYDHKEKDEVEGIVDKGVNYANIYQELGYIQPYKLLIEFDMIK